MSIYVDSHLDPSDRLEFLDAIDRLEERLGSFLASIPGNVIITTYDTGLDPGLGTGVYFPWMNYSPWKANLESHFSGNGTTYNPTTDTIIFVRDQELGRLLAGNYFLEDVNGDPEVGYTFDRFLFHELAHVASVYNEAVYDSFAEGNNPAITQPWEADTIAIAAENILFRQHYFRSEILGGHGGVTAPAYGAVSVFDELFGDPSLTMGGEVGNRYAKLEDEEGGVIARKFIFERGYDPDGKRSDKFNHYILNEIEKDSPLIKVDGTLESILNTSISGDSASARLSIKAVAAHETLSQLADFEENLENFKFVPDELRNVLKNSLPTLDQTRARMISLETSSLTQAALPPLGRVDKRDSQARLLLIQDCFLRSSHGSRGFVGCGVGTDRATAAA